MNYIEFAKSIKSKYPEYGDMDDMELAKSVVAKYPEYSDVDFSGGQSGGKSTTSMKPIERTPGELTQYQPQKMTLGGFLGNIPRSAGETVKGLAGLFKPETYKTLAKTGIGAAQQAIPGKQGYEEYANRMGDMLLERYGGIDNIKRTAYNDPVGFAVDIAGTLETGGALAGGKAGATVSKIGRTINPITQTVKGVGKVAGKVGAPFAGMVDTALMKKAQDMGVNLPASAYTKSWAAKGLETLARKGAFGGKIIDKVEEAGAKLNSLADDFVKRIDATQDVSQIGKNISDSLNEFRNNYVKTKNELYSKSNLGGKKISVEPAMTRGVVNKILEARESSIVRLGHTKETKFFASLQERLPSSEMLPLSKFKETWLDASAMRDLRTRINSIIGDTEFGKFSKGYKAELKMLADAIDNDLDDAIRLTDPDLATALDNANTYYRQGLEKLSSSWGRKIQDYAHKGQYDKIVGVLENPSISVDDISKIRAVIGDESFAQMSSHMMGNIFKKSKAGSTGIVSSSALENILEKQYGMGKITAILTPEQVSALDDIRGLLKAYHGGEAIAKGSQTAFSWRLAAQAGTLFRSPIEGVKLILGDSLFSKFIASPTGQKWLTSGYSGLGSGLQKSAPAIGGIGYGANILDRMQQNQPR